MSEISSTSELTTKEIVEQAIQDYHMSILPYLAKGNNGYSDTPIGAIQFFDDDTAPSGWLVADGTVYNIDDYPFLANHYERVHGSKNHYGGDGVTTFAVPDWRGEFFRASGPNAHSNQGYGGEVGEHQDATEHLNINSSASGNGLYLCYPNANIDENKCDSKIGKGDWRYASVVSGMGTYWTSATYTSRPTNTSLLCCIKAVPAGINYSLEEQEVDTWIDGKPLWKCTYNFTSGVSVTANQWTIVDIDATNMGQIVKATAYKESAGLAMPIEANPTENNHTKVGILAYRTDSGITKIDLEYTKTD